MATEGGRDVWSHLHFTEGKLRPRDTQAPSPAVSDGLSTVAGCSTPGQSTFIYMMLDLEHGVLMPTLRPSPKSLRD